VPTITAIVSLPILSLSILSLSWLFHIRILRLYEWRTFAYHGGSDPLPPGSTDRTSPKAQRSSRNSRVSGCWCPSIFQGLPSRLRPVVPSRPAPSRAGRFVWWISSQSAGADRRSVSSLLMGAPQSRKPRRLLAVPEGLRSSAGVQILISSPCRGGFGNSIRAAMFQSGPGHAVDTCRCRRNKHRP
jgi:hypothetical protein